MTNTAEGAQAPERLHALDAVRGFALLLGIAFHATGSFLPSSVPLWPVEDSQRSTALGLVFFTTHVFGMTAFFLIAGFFAHMSFHRRGALGFIGDRLKRIALPLVVGWPFIFAAITAVVIWGVIAANGGVLPKGPAPVWPTFPVFPLTHLWFLYVLLELYAVTLIARAPIALIDRGGHIRAGIDRLVGAVVGSWFAPVVLAAPLFVVFGLDPEWRMWFGITTPDSSFVTNLQAAVGFGTAFGFGWLLHRRVDLLAVWERRWALNLVLAIGFMTASLAIAGLEPSIAPMSDVGTRLAGAACYTLATWTTTFAVIGLALRFLSGFSPARRYIADASYWLYIIHLPLVLALQVAVTRLDWPWPAKYAAILGVAFPLMFASYQLLVRHSFIGAILNGRRAPRRLQTHSPSSTPMTGVPETSR